MKMRRWYALVPLGTVLAASLVGSQLRASAQIRLAPELAWSPPSVSRPLGCGEVGVDLLSLVSLGLQRSLALAVAVALFGLVLGTTAGAAAALARGPFERGLQRTCDLVQAFPGFVLALAVLAAVRSPTRLHMGLVFALTAWAPFARLALVQTQSLRSAAFVQAAKALGLGRARLLVRHVLPNLLGVAGVQLGATAAAVATSEAGLAFVGLGPADGVSLGAVLDQGVASMVRAPHVLVVGALAVFTTSASLLVAGRAAAAHGRSR
jgi:peptide/nickel transport system permease protein